MLNKYKYQTLSILSLLIALPAANTALAFNGDAKSNPSTGDVQNQTVTEQSPPARQLAYYSRLSPKTTIRSIDDGAGSRLTYSSFRLSGTPLQQPLAAETPDTIIVATAPMAQTAAPSEPSDIAWAEPKSTLIRPLEPLQEKHYAASAETEHNALVAQVDTPAHIAPPAPTAAVQETIQVAAVNNTDRLTAHPIAKKNFARQENPTPTTIDTLHTAAESNIVLAEARIPDIAPQAGDVENVIRPISKESPRPSNTAKTEVEEDTAAPKNFAKQEYAVFIPKEEPPVNAVPAQTTTSGKAVITAPAPAERTPIKENIIIASAENTAAPSQELLQKPAKRNFAKQQYPVATALPLPQTNTPEQATEKTHPEPVVAEKQKPEPAPVNFARQDVQIERSAEKTTKEPEPEFALVETVIPAPLPVLQTAKQKEAGEKAVLARVASDQSQSTFRNFAKQEEAIASLPDQRKIELQPETIPAEAKMIPRPPRQAIPETEQKLAELETTTQPAAQEKMAPPEQDVAHASPVPAPVPQADNTPSSDVILNAGLEEEINPGQTHGVQYAAVKNPPVITEVTEKTPDAPRETKTDTNKQEMRAAAKDDTHLMRETTYTVTQVLSDEEAMPLPIEEVVELALNTNPTIGRSRATKDLYRASLDDLQGQQGPQLSAFSNLSGEYDTSDESSSRFDDSLTTKAGVRLNYALYTFGAASRRLDAGRKTVDQATEQFREAQESVAFDVISTYLEVLRQKELLDIEKFRVDEHQEFLSLIEEAAKERQIVQSQLHLARTGLSQKKQAYLNVERQLQQATYAMERLTGKKLPVERFQKPFTPIVVLPEEEEFVAMGMAAAPEIGAIQNALDAAEYQREAATQDQYGSINLNMNVTGDRDLTSDQRKNEASGSLLLEYSVPLYTGGSSDARIRQARAAVEQTSADLSMARNMLKEQLRTSYYAIQKNDEILRLAKDEELNAARTLEDYKGEIAYGNRSFSDVMAQIDNVAAAKGRQLSARISKTLAAYAIIRRQGILLDQLKISGVAAPMPASAKAE